jgi:hypothetical protein
MGSPNRLLILFLVLLLGAAVSISLSTAALPDPVASHFRGDGVADGFMSRAAYQNFLLGITIGIPLLVVGAIAGLPRLLPISLINLPNRDYWLAPERQEQSLRFLTQHGLRFGCMMVALLWGVSWLVVRANRYSPPRLENTSFFLLLGAFLLGCAGWMVILFRRFGKR